MFKLPECIDPACSPKNTGKQTPYPESFNRLQVPKYSPFTVVSTWNKRTKKQHLLFFHYLIDLKQPGTCHFLETAVWTVQIHHMMVEPGSGPLPRVIHVLPSRSTAKVHTLKWTRLERGRIIHCSLQKIRHDMLRNRLARWIFKHELVTLLHLFCSSAI